MAGFLKVGKAPMYNADYVKAVLDRCECVCKRPTKEENDIVHEKKEELLGNNVF